MGPSTAVTRKLCAQVLEDTMKGMSSTSNEFLCRSYKLEVKWYEQMLGSKRSSEKRLPDMDILLITDSFIGAN